MSIDNEHKPHTKEKNRKSNNIEVLMDKAKQVYDTPDKGILWGWEVSAYVWTKAISAGAFLIPFMAILLGYEVSNHCYIMVSWNIIGRFSLNRIVISNGFRQTRPIFLCLLDHNGNPG